jgi:hypothetical protein
MKKVFRLGSIFLIGVLSACASLIPDQSINNVLGLNGTKVTLSESSSALTSQATKTYSGNIAVTFTDFEENLPVSPGEISEMLGIKAEVKVSSIEAEAAFPSTVTLSAPDIDFTVTDGSGNPEFDFGGWGPLPVSLTINKGSCSVAGGKTTCTYTASAIDTTLGLMTLAGANLTTFITIVQGGGSPNTLTGSFSLNFTGDLLPPADSQITVTLQTSEGTIKF